MAIAAGGASVVDTALIAKARMRSIVTCVPVVGIMAAGAIRPKHASMEGWIGMARNTGTRRTAKAITVAAAASQVGMCTCQFEG